VLLLGSGRRRPLSLIKRVNKHGMAGPGWFVRPGSLYI